MMVYSHVALNCKDPIAVEKFYTKHFGFTRARLIPLGDSDLVFIKSGNVYLELFKTDQDGPKPDKDGSPVQGVVRHIAFQVDDVDAKIRQMGSDAKITLGPLDFGAFIPGWRTVWLSDPAGNIVEVSQGYVDQNNPPPLA